MNRMISLARITFAGLGIYLLIGTWPYIIQLIVVFMNFKTYDPDILTSSFLVINFLVLILMIWLLIIRGEMLARKLIAKDIAEDTPLSINITLTMAFRLVSVGAGLLVLRTLFSSLQNLIRVLNFFLTGDNSGQNNFVNVVFPDLVHILLLLVLAVYLLWGAPHFVRWQVRKTLEFCDEHAN